MPFRGCPRCGAPLGTKQCFGCGYKRPSQTHAPREAPEEWGPETYHQDDEPFIPPDPPKAGGGLRYNSGKVPLDLLPAEWVWGLGLVMQAGARKYEPRNWEKGMSWMTCVGCLLRHVYKWLMGEKFDPETGCHHMLHAAWNCLALVSYETRGLGTDDRPEYPVGFPTLQVISRKEDT